MDLSLLRCCGGVLAGGGQAAAMLPHLALHSEAHEHLGRVPGIVVGKNATDVDARAQRCKPGQQHAQTVTQNDVFLSILLELV